MVEKLPAVAETVKCRWFFIFSRINVSILGQGFNSCGGETVSALYQHWFWVTAKGSSSVFPFLEWIYHRITEHPVLQGTHEDNWIQLLALYRDHAKNHTISEVYSLLLSWSWVGWPECMMPFFAVLCTLSSLSDHVLSCNAMSEVILLLQHLSQLLPSQPSGEVIKNYCCWSPSSSDLLRGFVSFRYAEMLTKCQEYFWACDKAHVECIFSL